MIKFKYNSKKLKQVRAERGWGQAKLAKKMKSTPATVCLLENGKRIPNVETFCRMCNALGVSPIHFLS